MSAAAQAAPAAIPYADRQPNAFVRVSFLAMRHLPRLTDPGKLETWCILFLLGETESAKRDKGTPGLLWSRPLAIEDFMRAFGWRKDSEKIGVTSRAVEDALAGLCQRKVVVRKKRGRSYVYSVPVEGWDNLPDYVPLKKPAGSADAIDAEEDTEGEEEANDTRSTVRVFERPIRVAAGRRSKPVDVPAAVEKLQIESSVEAEVDATVTAGVLRVKVLPQGEYKANDTRSGLRVSKPQVTVNKQSEFFGGLHDLLDDYWRRHHGRAPDEKLLAQVMEALGKPALLSRLRVALQAKIKRGTEIGGGLLVQLARDVAESHSDVDQLAGAIDEEQALAELEAWEKQRV